MNKTAIKNFAIWARNKLIADIKYKAGLMGITPKGINTPLPQSTSDMQFFDIGTKEPYAVTGIEIGQRGKLKELIESKATQSDYVTAFNAIVEEVAYTWFNRLIAVRFMEVNDYLPGRIRVLSSESVTKAEPDLVTTPFESDLEFTGAEKERILQMTRDNKLDELFRLLFIKQCNALNTILPELFEKTDDYTELLLNISFTDKDGVVYRLTHDIAEEDFKEAVEIIGWLYQYYNDERKNEVINIYKGIVKKEDIPAATQLFTTDWVVRYMVDNSLGRYWIERNPQSKLAEKLEFFVTPKDGHIAYVDEKIAPTDLTFFDPCMGSGHILVYAFDVLMEIYRECGYSDRDAAESILQNNLYGLDIDNRAYQIAYFAVMMRARCYDRRALTKGLRPNIYPLYESYKCKIENKDLQYLMDEFRGVLQYGSLIDLKQNIDLDQLQQEIDNIEGQLSLCMVDIKVATNVIKIARVLMNRYCVVCTNPPYLNKMNPVLKDYILAHYKDYSGDLFSVFMFKNFDYCKAGGYSAFMTPFVWMFIKTYEPLRNYIIANKSITTLIQMEYSAFEEATVPICSFVLKNSRSAENGLYFKLSDFKGGMEVQKQKVLEAVADKNCGYFYEASMENYLKIPGMPIAYWVSEKVKEVFEKSVLLSTVASPEQGMATADNNRFVRKWYEVSQSKISFNMGKDYKWFPYNNGGGFRRWYGYNIDVVDWENNGHLIKSFPKAYVRNEKDYFKIGITWNAITSSDISVRFFEEGFIFSNAGMAIFTSLDKLKFILGFINSTCAKCILKAISPTLNYNAGDICNLPLMLSTGNMGATNNLVDKCISLSRSDWDSFETSWDFKTHPLIAFRHNEEINQDNLLYADDLQNGSVIVDYGKQEAPISLAYDAWERFTDRQFNQLKANEEELNRIFIDIYGLQDELTPEVGDKDVTIRKADLERDIRSFISYAVGCMFGRYSPYKDGLIYAGGDWDYNQYENFAYVAGGKGDALKFYKGTHFYPDKDNIIPITDEEYFADDIVHRFVNFVDITFGAETLEQNLDFIADALGSKGNTSRDVIRNYFLKDFFKDHCKTYQKRPIYWMFDSGKENGFKALIYMHRYNEDTIGNLRIDYLHRMQRVYESEIARMQDTIDNSENAREVTAAEKRKEKLTKQLKETKDYDEKIAHLALARIAIDLDDGVKVNYEKVQTGTDGEKLDVLAKI